MPMVPFQGHNHLLQIWVVALYLEAVAVWVSEKPRYILGFCAMAVRSINFDAVILACHSDQCLKILTDPTPDEIEILSSIPYQKNM